MYNSTIDTLAEFPFRRLADLLRRSGDPGRSPIDLSIGEPKHAPPAILAETVAANAELWNRYPPPAGSPELLAASAHWLERRCALPPGVVEPGEAVLAVAGSKEALFLAAQTAVAAGAGRTIVFPNPLYAVYAAGAAMAGVEPSPITVNASTGHLPDLDAIAERSDIAALYLCNPSNPQGAVASEAYLVRAIGLARERGFALFVDECYSEIWRGSPPTMALDVAHRRFGDFSNVVVFNSLSKRSNAAGLRAGLMAGDPVFLAASKKLRAYASPVVPLPLAAAAAALWSDETHVEANRAAYDAKFALAERKLAGRFGYATPAGGFFAWLEVEDGEAAAAALWREAGLKTLPGAFLACEDERGSQPGGGRLRIALAHDLETLDRALDRLTTTLR